MLSKDVRTFLQQYADGNVSNAQLDWWLAEQEYRDDLPSEERDTLASLRLIVIEEAEGHRPSDDILDEVAAILARDSKYVTTIRTGATTTWSERRLTSSSSSVAQRAGI